MLTLEEGCESNLIAELLSAYLENRDASIKQMCERFGDVDIEQEDFDRSVLEFNDKTEKINDYIQTVYGETAFLKLSNEKIVEIDEYIESQLKFQLDGAFFLAKFELDNDIKKKKKYLKKIIAQYCQTRSFPDFGYKKDDRSGICRKSYERLKQNLSEYEEEIKKSYDNNKNLFFDGPLVQRLTDYGKTLGFSSKVSYEIILGLQKELESSQNISSTLSSLERSCVFLDEKIVFDGRHFLMEYINVYCKDQIQGLAITTRMIEKLDTFSDTILSDIAQILNRFIKNSFHNIGEIEGKLGLGRHEEIYQNIYTYVNEKGELLAAAQEVFDRIDARVDMEEEYRRIRKASRSRWVGGGLGVGGAIKGAATAGVMNLGTGAMHSVINGIGNVRTNFRAAGERQHIIIDILSDIPKDTKRLLDAVHPILMKDIKEHHPDYLWKLDDDKVQKKRSSTLEDKSFFVPGSLSEDPYYVGNYVKAFIVLENRDKLSRSNPDFQTLLKISEWFHIDFKTPLKALLENDMLYDLELKKENLKNVWNRISILCSDDEKVHYESLIYDRLLKKVSHSDLSEYQKNLRSLKIFFNELQIEELETWLLNKMNQQYREDIDIISEKVKVGLNIDERRLRKLIIEKEIASKENVRDIERIVDTYVTKKAMDYIQNVSLNDSSAVKDIEKQILILDGRFSTSTGVTILKNRLNEQITYLLQSIECDQDVIDLETYISEISDKILDFGNRKEEVSKHFSDLKKVYDYVTDYSFEMETKGNIKKTDTGKEYATLEEAAEIRAQVLLIQKIYETCDIDNEDSIRSAILELKTIYSRTGFGSDVIKEMELRAEKIDLKERTVLGTVYSTREKADEERKKVVGNQKYATRQEAEQERKRQSEENVERKQIAEIESNMSSNLEILKEIRRRNFKSRSAMEKIHIYEQKVLEEYDALRSLSTQEDLTVAKIKVFLLCVAGIFVSLIGLGVFFSGGWIAKIIAVVFVLWIWGTFSEAQDDVSRLKDNRRRLIDIENTIRIYK